MVGVDKVDNGLKVLVASALGYDRQVVAERTEAGLELDIVEGAGLVAIKVVKGLLPLLEVLFVDTELLGSLDLLLDVVLEVLGELLKTLVGLGEADRSQFGEAVVEDKGLLEQDSDVFEHLQLTKIIKNKKIK